VKATAGIFVAFAAAGLLATCSTPPGDKRHGPDPVVIWIDMIARINSWWHGDDPVPVADPFYGQPAPQKRYGAHGMIPDNIEDHFIESYIHDGAGAMDQDDLWAAEMCRTAYGAPPAYVLGDCRVHVFPKTSRKCLIVEGTKPYILMDVVRDLRVDPMDDLTLGTWPSGFAKDIRSAQFQLIRDFYGEAVELGGHSKGAAESAGLAAVFVAIGRPPAALTLFGCPGCCGGKTQKLLAA
jgi:hypothetical protein